MKSDAIKRELERIAAKNGGLLRPPDVVDAARSPRSILHSQFEWDDTEAAQKYRLHQARNLINVSVSYILPNDKEESRVFVSLKGDRHTDGGYRTLVSVLSTKDLREKLLAEALEELEYFTKKYSHLEELADVFSSVREARKKVKKKAA